MWMVLFCFLEVLAWGSLSVRRLVWFLLRLVLLCTIGFRAPWNSRLFWHSAKLSFP
ncbi:hypothetical protein KSP40_PGU008396 [Platanthera guangdongensis]|uniref:Uncharacterized protein n=1 Tax=Platanthera guangdongensis TaxID=2320717 RepID=A0ABR2M1B8_9ASPA